MDRQSLIILLSIGISVGFSPQAEAVILRSGDVTFDFLPVPSPVPPSLIPGDVRVGRTAPGSLTVNGGSTLELDRGEDDGPFMVIGRRVGSDGSSVLIDDGTIRLTGDDSPGGSSVHIGREGFGRMTIENGGALILTNPDQGNAGVGGAGISVGRDVGGGVLEVDNGSVTIDSEDSALTVGREGATAQLMVRNGSTITILDDGPTDIEAGGSITVGRSGPANASMTVDESTVLVRSNDAARLFVGREEATGTLHVSGETSNVTIDGADSRLVVGLEFGSTGAAVFDEGAVLDITGEDSDLDIARLGGSTGSVTIQGGATVNIFGEDGDARIAADFTGFGGTSDGGVGSLRVEGAGSQLNVQDDIIAGSPVSFGGSGAPVAGIVVADGGVIAADRFIVGLGATLSGTGGFITAELINDGGLIAPGFSPGTLTVDSFTQTSGILAIEIAGLGPGQFDVLNVLGDATFNGGSILFSFIDGFLPSAGDIIPFLTATGNIDFVGTSFDFLGVGPGFDFSVSSLGDQLRLVTNNAPVAVPEPPLAWLLLSGFLGAGLLSSLAKRRQRRLCIPV